MKFLLVSSFLLVCTAAAAISGTKNISVNGDGSIRITSSTGNQVYINQEGPSNAEIAISGPGIPTRIIQLQGNLQALHQVLQNHQGVVSEGQYQALLAAVGGAVQNGQINPLVLNVLQGLGVWGQSQGISGWWGNLHNWNILGGASLLSVQQPVQAIHQAEQNIQQLEAVQQQLQQQISNIEQLNQIGGLNPVHEQQQLAQLSGAQQAVHQLEQQQVGQLVGAVQQLQQQGSQQLINQLQGQGQQWSGWQHPINQWQGQQGLQQPINQIQQQQHWNVPQSLVSWTGQHSINSIPWNIQQWIQQIIGQSQGIGLLHSHHLSPAQGHYWNAVPQVQVY